MAWLIIGSGVQEPLTVALLEASPANPVIIDGMCLIPPKQPTDEHISTAPVVASGCQCWESESAPAVSSTNTQQDIDSHAESGSGKPLTCQSELTSKSFTPSSIRQLNSVGWHLAFFKSTHSKAWEKGPFLNIGDGVPTVVHSECESDYITFFSTFLLTSLPQLSFRRTNSVVH